MSSAVESYIVLLPKIRCDGRGGLSASCQKVVEMLGESWVVVKYDGLQGNDMYEGREGFVADYRELPGGNIDDGRGRGCRKML